MCQLFSMFGMPDYIHSDQGPSLISTQLKLYLNARGVATSQTSVDNAKGNGQVEWYNGVIWKIINLALKSNKLHASQWESIITDALHSLCALLCTSSNSTSHERLFNYQRCSTLKNAVPTWLSTPVTVLFRWHNRQSKYDPLVEEVEPVQNILILNLQMVENPQYLYEI